MCLTTEVLQNELKNCIGRSTVEVRIFNGGFVEVYHYNALIAVYNRFNSTLFLNKAFYDYSPSTARVRNEFSRWFGMKTFNKAFLNRREYNDELNLKLLEEEHIVILDVRNTRGYTTDNDYYELQFKFSKLG